MTIIIELTNKDRKALERHTFDQNRITIGRAYDNDLIISDSYADPYHAVIEVDDAGTMSIQDLGSTNGTYLDKHPLNAHETQVASGAELLVGQTHIRALDASHTVPPAVMMTQMERLLNSLSRFRFTLPLLMLCFLLTVFNSYQSQFREAKLLDLSLEGIMEVIWIVGWATIWATIGRISRHEFKFQHQLIASIAYFIAYIFIEWGGEILAFNVSNQLITGAYYVGLYGLALSALFSLNFRFAFQHPSKKRRLMALGLAWSIVGLVVLSRYANVPEFEQQPNYTSTLLPGYLQAASPVNKSGFLEEAEAIFEFEE